MSSENIENQDAGSVEETPATVAPVEVASIPVAPVVAPSAVAPTNEGLDAEAEMRRISRRSFMWAGTVALSGIIGLKIFNDSAPADGTGIKSLFRQTHEFNERVARSLFFSDTHTAREFPRDWAVQPRNNYKGATPEIDVEQWRLKVSGFPDGEKVLTLTDLESLPKSEQTTELKCVEGWSVIVNWSGIPFAEFAKKYPPPPGTDYVAMRSEPEGSEDEWYYVGLDMPSCLHPQTLLATHMNGQPLNSEHGAPLRLVMPHKYGIKNIKLITHISYENARPKDYWADQGYDWYAGL